MLAELLIALLLIMTTGLYWWLGKVYIGQPKHNHPAIFWNRRAATMLTHTPDIGFLAVSVLGFLFTDYGWSFLIAVFVSAMIFRARPYR